MTSRRLISVSDAAREIGTTPRKVHDLIAAGLIRTRTLPGERRAKVVAASIDEWLNTGSPDAPERRITVHPMVVPPFRGRDAA